MITVLRYLVIRTVSRRAAVYARSRGQGGRYTSAYQLTFSIGDIVVPATVTAALHMSAVALWLPLSAVALLDLVEIALLARWMLTWRVGTVPPETATRADRLLEADGI